MQKCIYLKSPSDTKPKARVGHTCTYTPSEIPFKNGKIYLIGGASHEGTYNEVYVLDLNNFSWSLFPSSEFITRYEHTAYCPISKSSDIFVFGGANENSSQIKFQTYNTSQNKWMNVNSSGPMPSSRTYHNGATFNDCLVVLGGGDVGSCPIIDTQVYIFDALKCEWKILQCQGTVPEARLGHAMIVFCNNLYVHGGMVGTSLFDDLFKLDLQTGIWSQLLTHGTLPSARASHSMFTNNINDIYIFGGLTLDGASNELFKLSIDSLVWTKLSFNQTEIPQKRLDFACTTFKLISTQDKQENPIGSRDNDSPVSDDGVNCCGGGGGDSSVDLSSDGLFAFIHGGMNEIGEMLDDCFYLSI